MWPLDARELKTWLEKYDHAKHSYTAGFISRIEALDALRNLRFRDDALKVEMLEWEREKVRIQKNKLDSARNKLRVRNFLNAPTSPSSSGVGDV